MIWVRRDLIDHLLPKHPAMGREIFH